MEVNEKKRVQVQIDKDLADNTEAVLRQMGLTPTMAISMLYRRIVAEGALPFKLVLNEEERANLRFLSAVKDVPVTKFKDIKEVTAWLNDSN